MEQKIDRCTSMKFDGEILMDSTLGHCLGILWVRLNKKLFIKITADYNIGKIIMSGWFVKTMLRSKVLFFYTYHFNLVTVSCNLFFLKLL